MTWAVWCAALLMVGGVSTQPLPSTDEDNLNLLLPSLNAQYQPAAWRQLLDPNMFLYAELDQKPAAFETRRSKRKLPSLSIVNPMEVLRQRLVLEIARKQRQNVVRQAEENRAFLQNVGKRSYQQPAFYDDLPAFGQLRRHSADQRQQAERPNADERED